LAPGLKGCEPSIALARAAMLVFPDVAFLAAGPVSERSSELTINSLAAL